jgi:hypothetical protein
VLDHLVLATPDIEATAGWLADCTGVVASEGGPHVGRGTRNRLCSLGDTYLEIIGPDPDQPEPVEPRPFGVDGIDRPRVVTWCARQRDLTTVVRAGAEIGLGYGEPVAMRRQAPGVTLDWHLSLPTFDTEGGLLPFFIDWGTSSHPSASAARGLSVVALHGEHPDPERISALLRHLGEDLDIRSGPIARLVVEVDGPAGRVTLP